MAITQIKRHISQKENFLLSGGAGSGKTYTLMQTLDAIFETNNKSKVACITYTNVAVDEIKKRSPYQNLVVSTIHDFLWNQIKTFQNDLKSSIIKLVSDKSIRHRGEVEINSDVLKEKKVEYREYKKLEEGIISHDEVIKLASHLFSTYTMMSDLTKDKFDYILIDEYQDTQKEVVQIFLEAIPKSKKVCVLGFFGDVMQSIYNNRTGNINEHVQSGLVKEVVKDDNYRCSTTVINLLNQIRSDIQQRPARDNKTGTAKFIYSQKQDINISDIKTHSVFHQWDFDDVEETKELYLTHKLIAHQKGFVGLLNSALSSDDITGDDPSRIISHLLKIEEILFLYKNGRYNEFLKKTYYQIHKKRDKSVLKDKIELLAKSNNNTIEEVIELADQLKLILKDDKIKNYISTFEDKYNSIKNISYQEIKHLYLYRENLSPYSTQHGVKGAEFDNVFVILDNGRWNLYSFKHLFEETADKESIIERTRKIYYVSCSRAKDNLVVFFHKPSQKAITKAIAWFGEENVIDLDKYTC